MKDGIRQSRRAMRNWGPTIWVGLIGAVLLWQTTAYRGLVALIAEWQFNEFGIYRPILTYALLTLVLASLPLLLVDLLRRRNERKRSTVVVAMVRAVALRSASRFLKAMIALSILAFGAALLCLLAMWLLPTNAGPLQRITANDTVPAKPIEGLTELDGKILYNRTAAFDEYVWFLGRNTRFAPIVEEGSDETAIRYFVELAPTDHGATASTNVYRGILRRNALPGELLRLYRYSGFRVFPEHYVLFSSAGPMRWPYIMTAVELAGFGFLILIVAGIQLFRYRRLSAMPDEPHAVG